MSEMALSKMRKEKARRKGNRRKGTNGAHFYKAASALTLPPAGSSITQPQAPGSLAVFPLLGNDHNVESHTKGTAGPKQAVSKDRDTGLQPISAKGRW